LLDELMGRVAGRFGRVEPRRTARAFVAGLLSGSERKNCWWLAEWAGHRSPDAMQRLLRTARWDADLVRDDVCGYVAEPAKTRHRWRRARSARPVSFHATMNRNAPAHRRAAPHC
jgi:hypothetical protein